MVMGQAPLNHVRCTSSQKKIKNESSADIVQVELLADDTVYT